jgi:predicted transcriptional regulator
MPRKEMKLGKIQLEIMKVIWDQGEVTARQISEALSQKEVVTHSTVQTLLRKLEVKGAVEHVSDGRTFLYRALIHQSSVAESSTRELLTRVFHGSVYSLVAHLIKDEAVSPDELKAMRELIDSSTEEGGPK